MRRIYRGKSLTVRRSSNMCGIFGSKEYSLYERLYIKNKQRGSFAGGSLYVGHNESQYIKKWEGSLENQELTGEYAFVTPYHTFLGHTQAPTGSVRDYNPKTTHPFEHGRWVVAHNGVLENYREIREEYLTDSLGEYKGSTYSTADLDVDSACIPALLDTIYNKVADDVFTISEVMSTLKGTFACWLHNKQTSQTYIVRSGSTLFGDIENNCFSSIHVPELTEQSLDEGVIYCMTPEGLTQVGTFHQSSPFFLF